MNTKIKYEYYDSGDYRVGSETYIYKGTLSSQQIENLLKFNKDHAQGFIPMQIGLSDLRGELMDSDEYELPFHFLDEVEETDQEPNQKTKVEDFYNLIMDTEFNALDYP